MKEQTLDMSRQTAAEAARDAGETNTAQNKQASGKQLVAIVFILALAAKMFLMPIFLIRAVGRDGYIAMAIDGAADLVALFMLLAAMKLSESEDLFELLAKTIGRAGARIVVGLIGLFMLFKLNIAAAETLSFYHDSVFTDFDSALMAAVLLIFLAAVGAHTLRSLCRLNELLVPIIVICVLVLAAIALMTGFDLANIFPALRDGRAFGKGVYEHAAWLGDFTPLLLFIGRTKLKKHTVAFAAGSGVVGTAIAVFFALVMSAAFGNVPLLVDSSTNLSGILQFSLGNVYGKIDMFTSVLWSIASFIEAALFFYAAARCIAFAVGTAAHFPVSLVLCAVTYALQVFAMGDPTVFSAVVTSPITSITTIVFTFLAPGVALFAAIKANRGKGKSASGDDEKPTVERGEEEHESEREDTETEAFAKGELAQKKGDLAV